MVALLPSFQLKGTPMMHRAILAIAAMFAVTWLGLAADPPPLSVAEGKVEKVGNETLTFQPRGAGGKFGKAITLKITGTSNLSVASIQQRAGKPVLVQREIKASDLRANQLIAVIYSSPVKGEEVLLAAVVQAGEK
jgi:hypothetical protein